MYQLDEFIIGRISQCSRTLGRYSYRLWERNASWVRPQDHSVETLNPASLSINRRPAMLVLSQTSRGPYNLFSLSFYQMQNQEYAE